MAFKMKGHELPGPNQRKEAPTKWINFVIQGIAAIASAAKKHKEEKKAKREEAAEAMKKGTEGTDSTSTSTEGSTTAVPDATESKTFKADMTGVGKKSNKKLK